MGNGLLIYVARHHGAGRMPFPDNETAIPAAVVAKRLQLKSRYLSAKAPASGDLSQRSRDGRSSVKLACSVCWAQLSRQLLSTIRVRKDVLHSCFQNAAPSELWDIWTQSTQPATYQRRAAEVPVCLVEAAVLTAW